MLLATQLYVARRDIWNGGEKKLMFNSLFGKAEIERQSSFEKNASCLFMERYNTLLTRLVKMR
jgi:hypothetical protein